MATDTYVIDFSDPSKSSFSIKSYTSNGPVFPTFRDAGLVDPVDASTSIATNTSLLLYGKALPDYGERIGENFVHLLENFSGPGQPVAPIAGQLWHRVRNYWYDNVTPQWHEWNGTTWVPITVLFGGGPVGVPGGGDGTYTTLDGTQNSSRLFRYTVLSSGIGSGSASWVELSNTEAAVAPDLTGSPVTGPDDDLLLYDGSSWVGVSGSITSGPTAPTGPTEGDLWFDTDPSDDDWTQSQLKIYDSSAGDFVSVARNYLRANGTPVTVGAQLVLATADLMDIGSPQTTNRTDVVRYGTILDLDSSDITNASTVTGTTVTNALDTLEAGKVDVSGEIMLGNLTFDNGTPGNAEVYLQNGSGSARQFIGYADNSVAVNKFYVDSVVGSAGDTFVFDARMGAIRGGSPLGELTGSPNPADPNTLYLWKTDNVDIFVPGIALVDHTHDASIITNSPNGNISSTNVQDAINELDDEKAPIDSPSFTGDAAVGGTLTLTNTPTSDSEAVNKAYVDNVAGNIRRNIFGTGGSPLVGPHTTPTYTVGRNQTFVTVNGIKQYQSLKGYQDVLLSGISSNTRMAPAIEEADPVLDEFIVSGDHTTKFLTGVGFDVLDSTDGLNDGSYVTLSNSTLTAEISDVFTIAEDDPTAAGSPPSIDGTYFTVSTPTEEYYVWMDVDAGGNDPAPGFGTAIQVSITSGDTAAQVATAIQTAMNLAGSPNDFTVTVLGSPAGVRITANDAGSVISSILDGFPETGFIFNQVRAGGNTLIPVTTAVPAVDTTGRVSPSYSATITIDGTSNDVVLAGVDITTYTNLINELNNTLGSATPSGAALLLDKDSVIRVTSNAYGTGSPITGSSINIVDAVFGGSPASELPLFSSLLDFLSIQAAVSAQTHDYEEIGLVDDVSTQIVFNSDPASGTIEVLIL